MRLYMFMMALIALMFGGATIFGAYYIFSHQNLDSFGSWFIVFLGALCTFGLIDRCTAAMKVQAMIDEKRKNDAFVITEKPKP